MFVTEPEGALAEKTHVRIRVTNMQGVAVVLNVPVALSVDKFKVEVSSCLGPGKDVNAVAADPSKTSLYHKLIFVKTGRILNEENTLIEEGVQDEDEILFVKKRVPLATPEHRKQEEEKKSKPTAEAITAATSGLAELNADRSNASPLSSNDFQKELRKILITLIDAAHKILCMNPEMKNMFRYSEEIVPERAESSSQPTIDEDAIVQLENMGFPKERAIKALKLNQGSSSLAIQWLLEHEDDPTIDEPLQEIEDVNPAENVDTLDQNKQQMLKTLTEIRGPNRARQVIEVYREFRRKEFKPNPKAVKMMTEMGFGEKEVTDSLRMHGNRQQEALEWLLGGGSSEEEEDFENGLDTDSDVYKAIMSNPVVQLTLSNPKCILAFSHMLDNPANTQQWLNDPDTGAMLIQISRIYHAERQASTAQADPYDVDISEVEARQ